MSLLGDVFDWITDADSWRGRGHAHRLVEHARYTLPRRSRRWCSRARSQHGSATGRFGPLGMNIANVGQTLPTFAILVLVVQLSALGCPRRRAARVSCRDVVAILRSHERLHRIAKSMTRFVMPRVDSG